MESWPAAITRAISICKAMVLVWSSNSIDSQEVSKELTLAMREGLMVIPYKIENIPPKGEWAYHLANSQWLDVCGEQEFLAVSKLCERLLLVFPHTPPPVSAPRESAPCSDVMDEWRELYWWLNRSTSLKSLDQKKLDVLQQKLGIPDGLVASEKRAYCRDIDGFKEILNQAFEDEILEQDEAEAIELARRQCCISNKETKILVELHGPIQIVFSPEVIFDWLPTVSPPEPQSPIHTPPPIEDWLVQKLETLFDAMKVRISSSDLYWAPVIPAKKLTNARRSYCIPTEERVFALIDATVFGSANNGMALCGGGVYLHNDWSGRNAGQFFVPWSKVSAESRMPEKGEDKIIEFYIGDGVHCNLAGSKGCREVVESVLVQAVNISRAT